jgi:histidine ammonia-lyase
MNSYFIDGSSITVESLWEMTHSPGTFQITENARKKMTASRNYIESRIKNGDIMYGVNTGFGAFSSVRISDDQIEQLQKNLIRSLKFSQKR